MNDLIERLERASGPDRKIDVEIFNLAHPGRRVLFDKWANGEFLEPIPHYTASLDAALTLGTDTLEKYGLLKQAMEDFIRVPGWPEPIQYLAQRICFHKLASLKTAKG